MKCDELKYERLDDAFETYPDSTLVIRKQYVDAAITELKAIIHELESIPHTDNSAVIERLSNENERLNAKLEDVQATAYAESVDAGMENRRMKRALWMARKAHAIAMFSCWDSYYRDNPNTVYRNRTADWLKNRWLLILDAIIKKEKEYK